jgi:hypothetical protein
MFINPVLESGRRRRRRRRRAYSMWRDVRVRQE